jgi:hypothetical protein
MNQEAIDTFASLAKHVDQQSSTYIGANLAASLAGAFVAGPVGALGASALATGACAVYHWAGGRGPTMEQITSS